MIDSTFVKLRDLLLNEFSEAEVATLCQEIGLDYEALPGTGFFGKTRGLLEVAGRDGKMRLLQARLRDLRPEAYAALGIGSVASEQPVNVSHETSGNDDEAPVRFPKLLLPLLLVGLLVVILAFAFLLPRIMGGDAAATLQATQTAVAALPTNTTIPVIGAATNPPVAASLPTNTPEPAQGVVVVATDSVPVNTPAATIAVIATPGTGAQATAKPVVVAGEGENHPAALAFKDINAQLPGFYRGEVTTQQLQQDWSGNAYSLLVAFSDTRLPRSLRLGTAPRTSMDITYEYVKAPAVTTSTGNRFTVTSREYWRYANPAQNVTLCDTRDYTYTVVDNAGKYTVTSFSSKVVSNGCR